MKVTDTIRTGETGPRKALKEALAEFESDLEGFGITYNEINLEHQSTRDGYNVRIEATVR